MLKGWLLSATLVLLWEMATMTVFRLAKVRRMFLVMTLLFLPTFPALVGAFVVLPADLWILPTAWAATPTTPALMNALFVHLLLYFTLVMFFFDFTRSITLRYLCAFERAPGHVLALPQLQEMVSLNQMIDLRIQALWVNGYVLEQEGRYRLTTKGRLFATLMGISRRIFPMNPS